MFSRKSVRILCVIILALINIVFLSISARHPDKYTLVDRVVMAGIVPFQEGATGTIHFCRRAWHHYFSLVGVREECDRLRKMLAKSEMERSRDLESKLGCKRLEELLEVKSEVSHRLLVAQVAGLDPSGWSKTIIINKGTKDGVAKGMAVIAPGGAVGHIIRDFDWSAQVLLLVDRSSAIDALIQRTRFRGIIEGETEEVCRFKYVVRKADVEIGDTVISSGFDGLFPKGLPVGTVSEISRPTSGLFQEVKVRPFVNFTRLEEVLVILD